MTLIIVSYSGKVKGYKRFAKMTGTKSILKAVAPKGFQATEAGALRNRWGVPSDSAMNKG
jgi:hypothetical protein